MAARTRAPEASLSQVSEPSPADSVRRMDLLLIGGVSGSGKSVALTALEDSGYYSVSHLPAAQLAGLLAHLKSAGTHRAAVVLDFRTGAAADLGPAIESARAEGWTVRFLYL